MSNSLLSDRSKRLPAPNRWYAGSMVLTAATVAGCGQAALPPSSVEVPSEIPGDYKFALVHPEDRTPNGRRVLRLDSARGMLEIEYLDRPATGRKAAVKVGMQPVSVRALSNREAWVVDPIADSISIVDLDSATVVAALDTAPQPTDVLFAGSPSRAYVTAAQGRELIVLDSITPTGPSTRIALQLAPR